MPNARDITQYPAKSAIQDEVTFKCIVPIATGGLVSGTGAPGVPSGATATLRLANGCGVSRIGTGLYNFKFAGAPNGSVRAWVELQAATGPTVVDALPIKRDIGVLTTFAYAQMQFYSGSGTPRDPANGDVLGFEFVAFSTGTAAGP
jgi:hypothetical protein